VLLHNNDTYPEPAYHHQRRRLLLHCRCSARSYEMKCHPGQGSAQRFSPASLGGESTASFNLTWPRARPRRASRCKLPLWVGTSTSELGSPCTQQVNDLPLNGRNFTQILTDPGVST